MVLQAIRYERGKLEILDQLKLPYEEAFLDLEGPEDAWNAIKRMQVRGAPAIAIVAALSLAVWCTRHLLGKNKRDPASSPQSVAQLLHEELAYLVTSRPTAVNLADAVGKLNNVVIAAAAEAGAADLQVIDAYIDAAEQMLIDDVEDNENIGKFGADWLLQNTEDVESDRKISVLTHCNTGSLATAGFGTALGVIRTLHSLSRLQHAFYTETRPYNQGCRLTGYELIHDEIPATLITDSMAAALLKLKREPKNITAIVVGADRVAANGDTANKIGTYSLAILAKYHEVKFVVAAPRTTIDLKTKSGEDIAIEERPQIEVTTSRGPPITRQDKESVGVKTGESVEVSIAAANTTAWNPAFDVTPAELIDAIVTEVGVIQKIDGVFNLKDVFGMPRVSREKK